MPRFFSNNNNNTTISRQLSFANQLQEIHGQPAPRLDEDFRCQDATCFFGEQTSNNNSCSIPTKEKFYPKKPTIERHVLNSSELLQGFARPVIKSSAPATKGRHASGAVTIAQSHSWQVGLGHVEIGFWKRQNDLSQDANVRLMFLRNPRWMMMELQT